MTSTVPASVQVVDSRVDELVDSLRGHPGLDRLFYKASELGEWSLIWHFVGALQGLRSDRDVDRAVRATLLLGAETVLVNGVLKSLFRRQRPEWDGDEPRPHPLRKPRTSSFPSGHASAAFLFAGVMAEGDPLWPIYYLLAAVVASSRVYVKMHHITDIAAGAAVGTGLALIARRAWPMPRR